ncbi:uncharacterized protein LOC135141170 [Zophobas morio]|uniref:uncharacterized protein LOC135141170 n=1 Tax=Zophobas morio TaxID=2755281 RepID=UPI003083911F
MEQDGGRPAIPASRFQVASVRRDISYLPVSLRKLPESSRLFRGSNAITAGLERARASLRKQDHVESKETVFPVCENKKSLPMLQHNIQEKTIATEVAPAESPSTLSCTNTPEAKEMPQEDTRGEVSPVHVKTLHEGIFTFTEPFLLYNEHFSLPTTCLFPISPPEPLEPSLSLPEEKKEKQIKSNTESLTKLRNEESLKTFPITSENFFSTKTFFKPEAEKNEGSIDVPVKVSEEPENLKRNCSEVPFNEKSESPTLSSEVINSKRTTVIGNYYIYI